MTESNAMGFQVNSESLLLDPALDTKSYFANDLEALERYLNYQTDFPDLMPTSPKLSFALGSQDFEDQESVHGGLTTTTDSQDERERELSPWDYYYTPESHSPVSLTEEAEQYVRKPYLFMDDKRSQHLFHNASPPLSHNSPWPLQPNITSTPLKLPKLGRPRTKARPGQQPLPISPQTQPTLSSSPSSPHSTELNPQNPSRTKRKFQNREAQRAFRARQRQHVVELAADNQVLIERCKKLEEELGRVYRRIERWGDNEEGTGEGMCAR